MAREERKVRRENVRSVDTRTGVVRFDPGRSGKITGSRFLAVLGRDAYMTEFKAACLIGRIYSEKMENIYTKAGETIEPVIRSYIAENGDALLSELKEHDGDVITVEEPIPKDVCGWDHFKDNDIFGGMVDGYILVNGRRAAVLEIKTSSRRWENGVIPEGYVMQGSLYAELSGLDRVVFAVGYPSDEEYEDPEKWIPDGGNFELFVTEKRDISLEMAEAEGWYRNYIEKGVTPGWTDSDDPISHMFSEDTVDRIGGENMMRIKGYTARYGSGEDLSDIEEWITDLLCRCSIDGADRAVYTQNGFRFEVDMRGVPKLTVTKI